MYKFDYMFDPQPTTDPYRDLLTGILSRSIIDLFGDDEKHFKDAYEFFFESPPILHPSPFFSFDRICEELKFNKQALRNRILELLDNKEEIKIKRRIEVKDRKPYKGKQTGAQNMLRQAVKAHDNK